MYGYTSQAIRDLIASKWDTVESQEDRLGEFLFLLLCLLQSISQGIGNMKRKLFYDKEQKFNKFITKYE